MGVIDNSGKEPLYIQLYNIILEKIETGQLLPGQMLESERVMASTYNVNRMIVKKAVNVLVSKGYLYRIQGKGTFVHKKSFDKLDLGFLTESGNSGITAMVKSHGIRISNKILTSGIIRGNNYLQSKLKIGPEEAIFVLHRIRFGNDEPIAVEYSYVPHAFFQDIESVNFQYVSLYDYMESKGHMPIYFDQKLQVVEVPEKECRHLSLKRRQPVYYFEFIGRDKQNTIVEYTESYTRADKTEFRFTAST